MHPIERGGLRRSQVGPDLVGLVVSERQDAPLWRHRGFNVRQTSGGGGCRTQMFEPVFHPFHRCAGLAGCQAHHDDVGENSLLYAEATARVARYAVAQLVARHLQRHRHDRMQGERSHEIGEDVIALIARQVLGDDNTTLHRSACVSRVMNRGADGANTRRVERRLWVTISERPVRDDVGAHGFMQHRRRLRERLFNLQDHGQWLILDLNEV